MRDHRRKPKRAKQYSAVQCVLPRARQVVTKACTSSWPDPCMSCVCAVVVSWPMRKKMVWTHSGEGGHYAKRESAYRALLQHPHHARRRGALLALCRERMNDEQCDCVLDYRYDHTGAQPTHSYTANKQKDKQHLSISPRSRPRQRRGGRGTTPETTPPACSRRSSSNMNVWARGREVELVVPNAWGG